MKLRSHQLGWLLITIASVVLLLALLLNNWSHNRERSLSWAAMMGDLDLVKKWEAKGANLNEQNAHAFNWTPLMAAICHENTNVVEYLLTRNVNLNLQDRNGLTALMWAIKNDDTNTVWLLLEKGADVSITGGKGRENAFQYAEISPHRAVLLEWLESYRTNRKVVPRH